MHKLTALKPSTIMGNIKFPKNKEKEKEEYEDKSTNK